MQVEIKRSKKIYIKEEGITMAQQMRLSLTNSTGSNNLKYLCDSLSKMSLQRLHTHRSTIVCHKHRPNVFNDSILNPGMRRECVLPLNSLFKSQVVFYKSGMQGHEQETEIRPKTDEMNLRLAVTNGYLSWTRNSYMMTLAGLTILNTSSLTDNLIISEVVFLVAFLNLSAGTIDYVHSLSSLRKRKVMQSSSSYTCQIAAIVHLFLWVSVLVLITNPDKESEKADNEQLGD